MTQSKDTFTFNGFEPANTTPVPDVLFDVLLAYLNEAQLKVMLYIIRRTLGFKKTADAISLNQFRWGITTKEGKKLDDGCGLKNFTTISNALKELEQMNCIESDKRETEEGNKLTTVYRIRFRGTTQNVVGTTDSVVPLLRKTYDRTTSSGGRVLRQTESQETVIQDTDKQQTVLQERERTVPESNTPTVSPPVVGDSRDEYPLITFADCSAYLEQQGVIPQDDAVEQMVQARTLYAHKHPRYEYRARPGLSEHPDDQLPGEYWPENDDPDKTLPRVQAVSKPLVEPVQQNHSAGTPNGAVVGDDLLSRGIAQGAASPKGKGKKPAEPKPETLKSPPVEPPSDMPWGTRKCLLWFDYWRGGILIGKFKLMQASTCAKGLAEQFSEEVVIQTRNTMADDPYWMARGGPDVCEVANNIHRYVRKQHLQLVATSPASKPVPQRILTKDELRRIPV